jgi:hypothetical protein
VEELALGEFEHAAANKPGAEDTEQRTRRHIGDPVPCPNECATARSDGPTARRSLGDPLPAPKPSLARRAPQRRVPMIARPQLKEGEGVRLHQIPCQRVLCRIAGQRFQAREVPHRLCHGRILPFPAPELVARPPALDSSRSPPVLTATCGSQAPFSIGSVGSRCLGRPHSFPSANRRSPATANTGHRRWHRPKRCERAGLVEHSVQRLEPMWH